MLVYTMRDMLALCVDKNTATANANKSITKPVFLALISHNSYLLCYVILACYCNFLQFPVT